MLVSVIIVVILAMVQKSFQLSVAGRWQPTSSIPKVTLFTSHNACSWNATVDSFTFEHCYEREGKFFRNFFGSVGVFGKPFFDNTKFAFGNSDDSSGRPKFALAFFNSSDCQRSNVIDTTPATLLGQCIATKLKYRVPVLNGTSVVEFVNGTAVHNLFFGETDSGSDSRVPGPPQDNRGDSDNHHSNAAGTAGVVFGVLAAVLVVAGGAFATYRRYRQRSFEYMPVATSAIME